MTIFKNQNIEVKTRECETIVLFSLQNFFVTPDGSFRSHAVRATLERHDSEGQLLPQDQWKWYTRFPVLYEYTEEGEHIGTWYANERGGYYHD